MPLRRRAARDVLLLLATAAAVALVAVVVAVLDVGVLEPSWRTVVRLVPTLAAAVVGGGLALLAVRAPRRRALVADLGAVAAGTLVAGLGIAALHGTRWGWFGLYADSSFRTQMATRYAEEVALVDYAYRDLPAYYPPAVGWLQGRLADVVGIPGWEAVKPVQLAVAALVPLLAFALWRQVLPVLPAAAVAGLTAVWTAHPQKPDEWLVLACLVPWWVLAVRDVRAPGVGRWPAWRLGVVLGLLLLVHTYWFLPMGVATLLALGYDAARGRRSARSSGGDRTATPRLPWRRALAIGLVGLAVASPSWVPVLLARLRLPSDDLQLRYAYPWGNVPPFPVPDSTEGVAGLLGLAWLLRAGWRWWRRDEVEEVTGALALALVGSCLTMLAGAVAMRLGVGFLAFKTGHLVTALLVAAGVVAAGRLLSGPGVRPAVAVVATAAAAAAAAHHHAAVWATGPPALVAQTTRYPDGSFPAGDAVQEPYHPTLFVSPDDPSVAEVRQAWRSLRPDLPLADAVLVTTRVDLLATTPVHGFLTAKSIYSHPNGRFQARIDLLREVAACPTPGCAARLLRDNPYDPVDGLVLGREGDRLVLPFMADDFPDRTRREEVSFPAEVLAGGPFLVRDVGRLRVVALRP